MVTATTALILHTARATSRALGVPLSQVLKAVRLGLVRPLARSTSGQMLFTTGDIAELARHRIEVQDPFHEETL
jgi:hypothetical protein